MEQRQGPIQKRLETLRTNALYQEYNCPRTGPQSKELNEARHVPLFETDRVRVHPARRECMHQFL